MSSTNLYFYFTPSKPGSIQQSGCSSRVQSKLEKLSKESAAQCDPESQMTQRILCESSEICEEKRVHLSKSNCPSKTLFDDNEDIEMVSTIKINKTICKQDKNHNKLQLSQRIKEFAARKKPTVSKQVNAILNRPSIKERYCHMLTSSSVLRLADETSQQLNSLMLEVESALFTQSARSLLLSQLMQSIPTLDILSMQQLVNVHPQLYNLSLFETPYGHDLLVMLPNQDENIPTAQQWRTHRAQDYKQRLYYQEQFVKQQQNTSTMTAQAMINEHPKLTLAIKQLIQSYNYANPATQTSSSNTSASNIQEPNLLKLASTIKLYFESRHVSNIFKVSVLTHLSSNLEIAAPIAEKLLNHLMELHPGFLTEVKTSLIGPILRINTSFDIESCIL